MKEILLLPGSPGPFRDWTHEQKDNLENSKVIHAINNTPLTHFLILQCFPKTGQSPQDTRNLVPLFKDTINCVEYAVMKTEYCY